ncbi:hypothetical protein KCP73_08030 [Salmonella enterica subsp. enterica]|nr:hypothetical protein KCP73_08030 [Salmonella enterica subsp. enterica]
MSLFVHKEMQELLPISSVPGGRWKRWRNVEALDGIRACGISTLVRSGEDAAISRESSGYVGRLV